MIDPRHRSPDCVEINRRDLEIVYSSLLFAKLHNDEEMLVEVLVTLECMFERALENA